MFLLVRVLKSKKGKTVSVITKYLPYVFVLIGALILGRWYSKERDKLLAKGEPWVKSWATVPGLMIIIIVIILIVAKIKFG